MPLSVKHTPKQPEENARIIAAGGHVTEDGQLFGISKVSRALGWFSLKVRTVPPWKQAAARDVVWPASLRLYC
jgi:serine/threonine protein phosphatase PrpC